MAALAILAGIGVFCWLLYGAAIYTLPFLVGAFVGLRAEQAGAGPLGGIVLGIGAGALVLVVGRAAFAQARGQVLRVAIALVFATPAALAGYSATSMLFGLASMSEDRREAFSILGAIAIGAIAWQRLAATPPSANDSDQRRPAQAWGQAHSTAHWIRAADLSGGRCKFERHRLMRIKIERYGRPSLERFARRANPHSPSRPTVLAFCLLRHPRRTPKPDAQGDASPSPACPCRQLRYSPVLLGNSLSREAHPFTSTMARP